MGKKASALIKIVDCVKRRLLHQRACEDKATCLKRELDRRRDGPVTDPCWTWVPGYLSAHEHEMTEWGVQWLEDSAERSKYGGRSYDDVLQSIGQFEVNCKNEKDDCNQPAKAQETPRGLRVTVATRLASSDGARGHALLPHHVQTRLGVRFSKPQPTPPPPPCGLGTPDMFAKRQDACPDVPQLVFISALPDIGHRAVSTQCSDIKITSPSQDALVVAFKAEFTARLFLRPNWLPYPPGVNVVPSNYAFKTSVTPMARVRLECSDGQALLAEAASQPSDRDGVRFEHDFSFTLAMPQAGGEYTLRSVLMASWEGGFSVTYGNQSVIDGSFERTSMVDPMTHEGDGSCDIGVFRVVDLRDLDMTIRAGAAVTGQGTDDDPFSAYPLFVAKSPYTFPFSTPQGVFELEDRALSKKSKTVVDSWSIIRDCARRRVNKIRVHISPPQDVSNATFFLPYHYTKDYAYIDYAATPLPRLSAIKINGVALDVDNAIVESRFIRIKNENLVPLPIHVVFSGESHFVYPNDEIYIDINKCDAYKGTEFSITLRHQEGFCEINGDTEKTVNIYVVDNSWKIFLQRETCVSLVGNINIFGDKQGRCSYYLAEYAIYSLFLSYSQHYDPECFDYQIDVDASVSVFGGVMASSIAISASEETHLLKSGNMTLECDDPRVGTCYQNLENNTISGTYRITKTNKLNGNSIIATYHIGERDSRYKNIFYGNLLSIEEVP